MTPAARLTQQIDAVCPIAGVSIGRWDNKQSWRIDFNPSATTEERDAASQVLAGFDPEALDVPHSVTPYQARRALSAAGLRDAAEAAVAAAAYDVRDAWEYAVSIERQSPFVLAIGAALGLAEADIDALFVAAAGY